MGYQKLENPKEMLKTIAVIVLEFPIAFIGLILMGLDGWCAGGESCRGFPGIITVIGALLISLYVQAIILCTKKNKHNELAINLLWIFIPTIIIYLTSLAKYYNIINFDFLSLINPFGIIGILVCILLYRISKNHFAISRHNNHKKNKK